MAVPSVGALVAGWLLVVPREHALNAAALSDEDLGRLEVLVSEIVEEWQPLFGAVTVFEHGPARPSSPAGCGVDHAHLHVVPTEGIDLIGAARTALDELTWIEGASIADARAAVDAGLDYLYAHTGHGDSAWLAIGQSVPSQALRRVMAAELKRPDEFDWRCYPQLDVVRATIRTVEQSRRN
jgi:diadenosine tetraphosphate (Ap4A) HIT family hydrolase